MACRVAVTGSDRGSAIAWSFIKFLLRLHKTRPFFVSPSNFKETIDFDALVISGGIDISPSVYGKKTEIAKTDPKRDAMEMKLLENALKRNIPVLGICRGMQMINVFYGGTLHLEIHELDLNRPHPKTPLPKKKIFINPHTKLREILKVDECSVNALHHQAIEKIAPKLIAAAHDENGITQAIEHQNERFVMGVQWHPEFLPYSPLQRRIFKAFVKNIKDLYNK
ncbi:gamma-glutamyl-gamma-aminobutyrate hydrolase family protein [Nitrosophilus alvini]|uniref:gamma-glutamyl-gamma-aminobutyrate hydrolase family protein n=1 Tax=Nitrosophilus alvini TaxID=2714855 RepID=UPI00190CCC32|nr:gamma-glutamyl-gamma-aminobutyrate hydrolase family protein [Nitrosophilus alvini]